MVSTNFELSIYLGIKESKSSNLRPRPPQRSTALPPRICLRTARSTTEKTGGGGSARPHAANARPPPHHWICSGESRRRRIRHSPCRHSAPRHHTPTDSRGRGPEAADPALPVPPLRFTRRVRLRAGVSMSRRRLREGEGVRRSQATGEGKSERRGGGLAAAAAQCVA